MGFGVDTSGYQSFEVLKCGVLHTLVLTEVVLVLLCIWVGH